MPISKDEVLKVGLLSRIRLSEEEVETFASQLSEVLDYVGRLQALDTEGVREMPHAVDLANVLRPDEPRDSLPPETAVAGAPDRDATCFRVPRVIDDGSSA